MKKGFTLIELLAVIVIISILTIVVMPNILNNVNNKRSEVSDSAKKMIYDATDIYVKENSEIYSTNYATASYCIKLETLVNSGKLVSPVKDMKTDKEIPLNYSVKAVVNEYNQFDYELVDDTICKIDTTSPTLTLSKETYIEGFDGWTFTNAYVDSNNILVLGEGATSGSAFSPYYDVNYQAAYTTYEVYSTGPLPKYDGAYGGSFVGAHYYDSNKESVLADNGYSTNGNAKKVKLNEWSKTFETPKWWYGTSVKYIKYNFKTGNDWSQPVLKIRNFKVYGQFEDTSFYLIKTSATDDNGISKIEYAVGNQDVSYFETNGTIVKNNQIKVTKNGVYTVCAYDTSGNKTIKTITIDKIKEA